MKVTVERCSDGYYRLTIPGVGRESVKDKDGCWTRRTASEALDLLEAVYRIPRRNVRFS